MNCPKCGFPAPYIGCPSCPPKLTPCLKCGEMVLVEPAPDLEAEAVLRRYRERGR